MKSLAAILSILALLASVVFAVSVFVTRQISGAGAVALLLGTWAALSLLTFVLTRKVG